MRVFEYVIVHRPVVKEGEKQTNFPAIIVNPSVILAKDEKVAQMMAVKAIPDAYTSLLEEVEITIRPF